MWFLFREGLSGLRKARIPVTLSILAITVLLFFNGIFFLTILKMNDVSNRFKTQFTVQFLVNPTHDKSIKELSRSISKNQIVKRVNIISPDSSLKELSKNFNMNLGSIISHNPLPVTIQAHIKPEYVETEFISEMVNEFKNNDAFMDIRYPHNYLKLLEKYGASLLLIIGTLGLVFFFLSVLMVIYTLKITIQIKRNFILITRLMGGTSFHIRFPFFIEAFIEGLMAAAISSGFVFIFQELLHQFGFNNQIVRANLIVFIFISGIVISTIGTQIALKKYLFGNEDRL